MGNQENSPLTPVENENQNPETPNPQGFSVTLFPLPFA